MKPEQPAPDRTGFDRRLAFVFPDADACGPRGTLRFVHLPLVVRWLEGPVVGLNDRMVGFHRAGLVPAQEGAHGGHKVSEAPLRPGRAARPDTQGGWYPWQINRFE